MRQYAGDEEDLFLQYAIRQSLDSNSEQVGDFEINISDFEAQNKTGLTPFTL